MLSWFTVWFCITSHTTQRSVEVLSYEPLHKSESLLFDKFIDFLHTLSVGTFKAACN